MRKITERKKSPNERRQNTFYRLFFGSDETPKGKNVFAAQVVPLDPVLQRIVSSSSPAKRKIDKTRVYFWLSSKGITVRRGKLYDKKTGWPLSKKELQRLSGEWAGDYNAMPDAVIPSKQRGRKPE